MVLAARYIRSYMLITTIMSLLLYKGRPIIPYIIGSEQERRNSIVNILELCPSCTNPSTYARVQQWVLILCICMCVLISITWVSKQRRGSPTDYALGLPLFWFPMSMCTFMGNTYSLCSCYAFNCFGNQQLSYLISLFTYFHWISIRSTHTVCIQSLLSRRWINAREALSPLPIHWCHAALSLT